VTCLPPFKLCRSGLLHEMRIFRGLPVGPMATTTASQCSANADRASGLALTGVVASEIPTGGKQNHQKNLTARQRSHAGGQSRGTGA